MSDLDPAIMDQFYMKDGVSASDVTHVSLDTGEILDATGGWSMVPLLCNSVLIIALLSEPMWVGGVWPVSVEGGTGLVQML